MYFIQNLACIYGVFEGLGGIAPPKNLPTLEEQVIGEIHNAVGHQGGNGVEYSG